MKKQFIHVLYLLGVVGILIYCNKDTQKKIDRIQKLSKKHEELFFMMNHWVRIEQDGKNISSYFIENGYMNIAIYGMGCVGKTLIRELKGTEVKIEYVMDKNADKIYTDIKKISDINSMHETDAIVVTPIVSYNEIKEELQKKIVSPIISLSDILDDM